MTLASGARLGSYEILSPLGAGGMGEVYKAKDTKLNRFVAIKVLPPSVARDGDALARFEREAQAIAALSHPNILAIHDFGTHDGIAFAVTELLQGETLREMLSGGALPLRKTVDFSRQICAGLAAAHAAGIVHRDLKPENVFVTNDGRVKILDFGLAKPVAGRGAASEETHSPTVTAYTEPGTVMGTVGYMSPEQVKAGAVDHRSDIFSFGAVLYEMLTGRRAFQRETAAETMTAVLREDPPEPSETGRKIPPALDRVVRHCLEKKADQRFQSASDIAFALEETSGAFSGASADSHRVSRFRGALGLALIAAVLVLAAGATLVARLRRPAATEPTRIHPLTFSGRDNEPAASPDGKLVAFTSWRDGTARVWIKQLAGGGEAPLTAGPDRRPRFSPDGSSVLFVRDLGSSQAIYRVGLIGGDPRKLIDDASEADWSPDGRRVVYLRRLGGPGLTTQIGVLDLDSGKDTVLAKLANSIATSLRWSPDGRDIAFTQGQVSNAPTWKLLRIDLASGLVEPLGPGPGNSLGGIAWSGDGRALFYIQSASVMGDISGSGSRVLRLDRRAGRPEPVLWADGLAAINASTGEVSRCDVLSPGRLVFSQRLRRQNLREAVFRAPGEPATTRTITEGSSIDRQPTYSPDGKWMLFSSNRSGNLDLWLMDPASGALRQVTDDRAQDWDPAFTSDGKHILWDSDRTGHLEVWIANVDGSGARQVTHDGVDAENPTETPDGNWVVYWSGNAAKRGVWKVHPDGSGEGRLLETDAVGTDVSPDGRYALYLKQDRINSINTVRFLEVGSGRPVPFEIPVRFSVGSPGIIWGRARWSRDGRSIYFVGEDAAARSGVFVQDFAPGRDTTATRRPLAGFSPDYVTESLGISPDGSRLVISTGDEFASISIAENVPGAEPPVRKSP